MANNTKDSRNGSNTGKKESKQSQNKNIDVTTFIAIITKIIIKNEISFIYISIIYTGMDRFVIFPFWIMWCPEIKIVNNEVKIVGYYNNLRIDLPCWDIVDLCKNIDRVYSMATISQ